MYSMTPEQRELFNLFSELSHEEMLKQFDQLLKAVNEEVVNVEFEIKC